MFPDVQELGRGDLGQVQVRRLLSFVCHDDPLLKLLQEHTKKKNPLPTFCQCLQLRRTPHCGPRAPRAAFNAAAAAALPPRRHWGRADSISSTSIWVSSIPPRACVYAGSLHVAKALRRWTERGARRGWINWSCCVTRALHLRPCALCLICARTWMQAVPTCQLKVCMSFTCARALLPVSIHLCVSERAPPGACLPVCEPSQT